MLFFPYTSDSKEIKAKQSPVQNPLLKELLEELKRDYDSLDALGLYTYALVCKAADRDGVVTTHSTVDLLMESLLLFPLNQSAWNDLLSCLEDAAVVESRLRPLADHWTYHYFCAHVQSQAYQQYGDALQLWQQLEVTLFPDSCHVQRELAHTHYQLRDLRSAQAIWQDLHNRFPYDTRGMDALSNILYVQEDAVALASLAYQLAKIDPYRPEVCLVIGNYYSLKQDRAQAVLYFERALALDPATASAWTLLGHELVEWKQTARACRAYRKALELDPKDYRAWYGLGQLYEILSMPLYSLYYFQQACRRHAHDARLWTAVGTTLAGVGQDDAARQALEQALECGDADEVAVLKLADLYVKAKQPDNAANCYMRHLQSQYALTHQDDKLVSLPLLLQGLPTIESAQATAILYLARYHQNNGQEETAGIFASRLLEFAGPEKEEAKALLRALKSSRSGLQFSS